MGNVVVTETTSNITVDSTNSIVTVSSTPSNIIVSNISAATEESVRNALSVTDAGGDGSLTYGTANGVFTYTGPSAAEVRAHISNTSPIEYNSSTGVISLGTDFANLSLQQYQETVVEAGNISGNVSFDVAAGTIHKATLTGDITGISFANIQNGSSIVALITQDTTGGHVIDTTSFANNWTNVRIVGGTIGLTGLPSSTDAIQLMYDDGHYMMNVLKLASSGTITPVPQDLSITGTLTANTVIANVEANAVTFNGNLVGTTANLTTVNATTVNSNLVGNVTGNVTGSPSSLAGLDTDDLTAVSYTHLTLPTICSV